MTDLTPLAAVAEDGNLETSASFGQTWLVRIFYNTDPEGVWVEEGDWSNVTLHGEFTSFEEAQAWMEAYPDGDKDLKDMDVICVNRVRPRMSRLPAFEMDVAGEYGGNAYPEQHEYRVKIVTLDGTGEKFLLDVQDHNGTDVGQYEFDAEVAEGLMKMASTAHSLDEYEDDWTLPTGLDRQIVWTLPTDMDHDVVLREHQIDEVGDWLSYATGETEYDGPEDRWEF